jgi:hypothetical protein
VLPAPEFVAGIRLRFSHSNPYSANIQVSWKKSDESAFPKSAQYIRPRCFLDLQPGENTLTIYIADTIDQVRIHADDKPFDFCPSEIVLLVPVISN